jgi:hypothetical protein
MRLRSKRGGTNTPFARGKESEEHAYWEGKKEVMFAAFAFVVLLLLREGFNAGKLEFVRCILLGKAFFCFIFSNLCQR